MTNMNYQLLGRSGPSRFRLIGITPGSVAFSGAALARVAADPAFANGSGKYFQSKDGRLIEARSSKMSYDEGRALKLWNDSKLLVRLQPDEEASRLRVFA